MDLQNLALRISQVDPHFHKLKYSYFFFSFFVSLWLLFNSFEIPPDFDHSKSLSYIKIKEIKAKIKIKTINKAFKTINKAFKTTKLKQKHGL